MPNYRITNSHYDTPEKTATSFAAENDEAAKEVFVKYTKMESYSWDDLCLVRIDTPAVAEETTRISTAIRQGRSSEKITHHV